MSTASIVAEMVLAALKRGAELTQNETDDQLVTFASWVLALDAVQAWLEGAPQPIIALPENLGIDFGTMAKWLPIILEIIAQLRKLRG